MHITAGTRNIFTLPWCILLVPVFHEAADNKFKKLLKMHVIVLFAISFVMRVEKVKIAQVLYFVHCAPLAWCIQMYDCLLTSYLIMYSYMLFLRTLTLLTLVYGQLTILTIYKLQTIRYYILTLKLTTTQPMLTSFSEKMSVHKAKTQIRLARRRVLSSYLHLQLRSKAFYMRTTKTF